MNKKILKNAAIALGVIFVGAQFIRPSTENPPVDPVKDFMTVENPPENIRTMVKNSCYDCHSHETAYPWYNQIVPVSWYLKNHIDEGRKEFNLSTWSDFPEKRKNRRLTQSSRFVKNGKMPLWDYTLFHSASRLDEQQKAELSAWFEKQAAAYPSAPPKKQGAEGQP